MYSEQRNDRMGLVRRWLGFPILVGLATKMFLFWSVVAKTYFHGHAARPDRTVAPMRRLDAVKQAQAYIERHKVEDALSAAVDACMREQPDAPLDFIAERLRLWSVDEAPMTPHRHDNDNSSVEQRKNLVRSVDLFSTLDENEVLSAARALVSKRFEGGAQIITQGEVGDCCFFIEAGDCVASVLIDGTPTEVARYVAGGFFGERALLRSEPRAATVTAQTAVVALQLSGAAFMHIIRERDLKEELLRSVSLFETMSDEQIAKLACKMRR